MQNWNDKYFFERTECPVCENKEIVIVYSAPMLSPDVRGFIKTHYQNQGIVEWDMLDGTDFVICNCKRCGLTYQKNVPNNNLLEAVYTRWIAPNKLIDLEMQRLTVENFRRVAGELETLFTMTGKRAGEITFLDYGFGYGRWARVARAMGAKVYATEIGDDKKRMAATIGVEMINDSDIDGMKFDIVHTEQVFEHLVTPAVDFRRLAAATGVILKFAVPKGHDVLQTLSKRGMAVVSPFDKAMTGAKLTAVDEAYVAIQPLEHLNTYSDKSVEYLSQANNMKIVSRFRRRSVNIRVDQIRSLMNLPKQVATEVAKNIMPSRGGYYVLKALRS